MSELRNDLRADFHDKEFRHVYADDSLNTYIATQIKVLREQRNWTQARLAKEAGMAQPRIAVMEDINYSSWSLSTLKRLAQAFDLRLSVKFDSFSSLIPELETFGKESLQRPSFADDRWFHDEGADINLETTSTRVNFIQTLAGLQLSLKFYPSVSTGTSQPEIAGTTTKMGKIYVMPKKQPEEYYAVGKTGQFAATN